MNPKKYVEHFHFRILTEKYIFNSELSIKFLGEVAYMDIKRTSVSQLASLGLLLDLASPIVLQY